jgi:hypothetical protein
MDVVRLCLKRVRGWCVRVVDLKSWMECVRWMDEEGEGLGWWWERQRSYKDQRGLTCLPQMLQKINPLTPRQVR